MPGSVLTSRRTTVRLGDDEIGPRQIAAPERDVRRDRDLVDALFERPELRRARVLAASRRVARFIRVECIHRRSDLGRRQDARTSNVEDGARDLPALHERLDDRRAVEPPCRFESDARPLHPTRSLRIARRRSPSRSTPASRRRPRPLLCARPSRTRLRRLSGTSRRARSASRPPRTRDARSLCSSPSRSRGRRSRRTEGRAPRADLEARRPRRPRRARRERRRRSRQHEVSRREPARARGAPRDDRLLRARRVTPAADARLTSASDDGPP